ncbi:Aspartate/glutamate/uridylate kinase [Gorgonomyces haynaldii]|nr:Aspartate/glutamate/uridylate kinase [Gorgonomyces haynaldii]
MDKDCHCSSSPLSKMGRVLVIKLGTSSICDETTFMPKLSNLSLLVETVVHLRKQGHKVMLVSSGAVGVGLLRLGLPKRPKHLSQVQAVAAVGQGRLMALYDSLFANFQVPIAQILLTRDNVAERPQYLNACNTLKELLQMDVVPIINENDSVSSSEIRFGDNDSLSAIAAGMVKADYLFLLTDVPALFTANPRTNPDAKPIRVVRDIDQIKQEVQFQSAGSSLGTGGMVTKLIAAELATATGVNMIITIGTEPQKIIKILDEISGFGESYEPTMGTHFLAKKRMDNKQWWIMHGLATHGTLLIDDGATRAITKQQRSSLFAAGIREVIGQFSAQQCVKIATMKDGVQVELGRGLTNYGSIEIQRIKGCQSSEIADILGYMDTEHVISRDNLALLRQTPQ